MHFLQGIFTKQWQDKLIKAAQKHGADEGKHGRPSPANETPDIFEENFITEGESLIIKANKIVTDFIRKTEPTIQDANSKLDDLEAEAANKIDLDALKNKVESFKNDSRTLLKNAYVKVIETNGYLNSFKATHNVKNAPDHPLDTMHFLSIIFIVLVVEGCLNAFFWKNDAGLLGGFFKALGVAGINIAFAMTLGLLFRYVNYKSSWSPIVGFSALVLGIPSVIWLNLWIASVRTSHSLSELPNTSISDAFQDSSSMLLFFVGLIFAMLAAFKGYYLFGSLPGYQKVCKDYEKAVENAEGIERILKTQIDSMITSEKNNLSQLLRNLTEINKALNKIKANVKSSKTHFEATSAEIFEAVNLVIKNYRQMNSKSRPANIPPPDYFKKDLSNTYEIIPTYFLLEESTNEISTRSEDLFTNISASINEQINSLSSFKAFELGPAIQEFMDKVRDDAKNLFISTIPRNGSE